MESHAIISLWKLICRLIVVFTPRYFFVKIMLRRKRNPLIYSWVKKRLPHCLLNKVRITSQFFSDKGQEGKNKKVLIYFTNISTGLEGLKLNLQGVN
jgi:hypothetical protein